MKASKILMTSVFRSINGECSTGVHGGCGQGEPTVFARTALCPVQCAWCDTAYAWKDGCLDRSKILGEKTPEEVYEHIRLESAGGSNVTITGGEPMLYDEGIFKLVRMLGKHFNINIYTSGVYNLDCFLMDRFSPGDWYKTSLVVDFKPPSAQAQMHTRLSNLEKLRWNDWLKCVIVTREDFEAFVNVLLQIGLTNRKCQVLVTPAWPYSKHKPAEIVEWIHQSGIQDLKIGMQMHKIIWPDQADSVEPGKEI